MTARTAVIIAVATGLSIACAAGDGAGAGGAASGGRALSDADAPGGSRESGGTPGAGGGGGMAGAGGEGTGGRGGADMASGTPSDGGADRGSGDGAAGVSDTAGASDTAGGAPNRGPAGGNCPATLDFPDPVPAGASATLVKSGFIFTEGPVWVASEKALLFSEFDEDGTTGRINRYDPADGTFTLFFQGVGINGLAVDERGGLVGASHGLQGITRIDVATRMTTPIPGGDQYMGKKFNSPNDVVVRGDGNIYFTDPSYQRPAGSAGQGVTAIYHWKDGVITRHGAGPQPNAIGISIDGAWLYVTSSMAPPVRKFALGDDGSVGDATTFVNMVSQGFATDCAGNVYLTSDKLVRVFSAAGTPRGTIGGFPQDLTNLAFGDEDRKTLYITARPGSIYKVRLNVPGFPN